MKKLLVLLLCLVLALPVFASAEEVPVTWSGTISVAPYLFGPYDESKDKVIKPIEKILKEKYGLDVTFEVVFVENANYSEIINTRISGGTAPDVFQATNLVTMKKYYDQGAIASWDIEFFKENAPHLYEFLNNGGYQGRLADYVDLFWKLSTIDGKMVTTAYFDEQASMPSKTLMYRQDWLDNLGVEELPYTLDDFVDLMYRFAEEDPDGNGIQDTYGLSQTGVRTIFGAYGSSYDSTLWLEDENGNLYCSDIAPQNKEALELCAKLYADKVLDPEFVTGENNGDYWAINHSFINGHIGVSAHASIDHYRRPEVLNDAGGPVYDDWIAINPNADFTYAPWPAGPEGEYGLTISVPVTIGQNYVYSSACDEDKLAAIFQIYDIFNTDDELTMLAVRGIEGEDYTIDADGTVIISSETSSNNEVGIQCLRGLYGPEKVYSEFGMYLDFYGNKTIKNRLDFFDLEQCDSYRASKVTQTLPSEADVSTELSTLRDETFVKFITGERSLDEYDAYVAEWMEMGGEKLTDEANDWWAENK